MKSLHLKFVAALITIIPLSAFSTVVVSMTMEEMTRVAPVVVRGTVARVEPTWSEGHHSIWTYSEIVVSEALKGPSATSVLIKQPGGEIGQRAMSVAGSAQFSAGEDVVVFLEPAVDEPGVYVVLSMSAGKVMLESQNGTRLARRNLHGLAFARPGEKGVVARVDEREVLGTAEAFLERIRKAAKGGTR